MRRLALLFAVLLVLLAPCLARACPSCSEAVPASSGSGEEDQEKLGRAYNQSIYLMVGMPYCLLGAVGFMVYRRLRSSQIGQQPGLTAQSLPPGEGNQSAQPGDRACSLPSRDGDS